jgi:hypothetical protein
MVRLMEVGVGDSTEKRLRDRVSGMARFFLSRTHHDGQGLTWTFATWNTGTENTSHGSMDASFIALAGKHDYSSVGNGDVNDLIGTFKRITSDDKQVASFVNGHGGSEGSFDPKDANQSCGRWLELAEYDHSLVKRCATVLAKGFDSEQVGYAKTLRYKK